MKSSIYRFLRAPTHTRSTAPLRHNFGPPRYALREAACKSKPQGVLQAWSLAERSCGPSADGMACTAETARASIPRSTCRCASRLFSVWHPRATRRRSRHGHRRAGRRADRPRESHAGCGDAELSERFEQLLVVLIDHKIKSHSPFQDQLPRPPKNRPPSCARADDRAAAAADPPG
jgi:hypothetical protein